MKQKAILSLVDDLSRIVDNWTATPLNDLHNVENAAEV